MPGMLYKQALKSLSLTGLLQQLESASGQHSKLNEIFGCSCNWPKSNNVPRYSAV